MDTNSQILNLTVHADCTPKVCKFFVEAVEHGKYGWFWTCPNGGNDCKYRHSLPPGFVLKTREQRLAEKAAMEKSPLYTLTLEDFLESERHKLTGKLTPVTPETFAKWKKERMDKKEAEEQAKRKKEDSGRALFEAGGFDAESDSDDEEESDPYNLSAMRKETERMRVEKEEERFNKQWEVNGERGGELPLTNDGQELALTNGHS